ncbi:MAG: pyruvate dehydrogenase (acetyl-transferring) E1 component subunit alpha [Zetaproteobacteria bacterium]|nr:pyruvate dehydrogenase (acetyl-transferring) E1 component subunit alpha [Pseudobdellovibrionaceae bacterium]
MLSNAPNSDPKAKAPTLILKSDADKSLQLDLYRKMCLFRRFEEKVGLAYTKRKFSGFCHLHIGQEALCAGVQAAIKDTDYIFSGYRSHTQAIAKGIKPGQVMAELFGKADGICRGKGGSMHMFSAEHRFMGGHGIVGGQLPLAAGVGFAIRYEEKDDIVVCYMGDAATNQGAFHEALNMAATWDIPVLYIIENNRYGMGTDIRRTSSIDHLWKRALSYDMDYSDVDGMNVLATYEHVTKLVNKMRDDKKPHLMEALTYRYRGHSVSDPGTYRTKSEVEEYQKNRDPIMQHGKALVSQGYATEAELKAWDKSAKEAAKEAEKFADESPFPPISEALDHNLVP